MQWRRAISTSAFWQILLQKLSTGGARSAAQGRIADNLRTSQYFPNLTDNEVTVSMVKAIGNSVSVVGQVNQPGTFAFDIELEVMQAIRLVGGLTPFADKDEIKILRRNEDGNQTAIHVDYSMVEDSEALDTNIILRGVDVVVGPQAGPLLTKSAGPRPRQPGKPCG